MKNVEVQFRTVEASYLEMWTRALREATEQEISLGTADDWQETVKYLLGDCPAKIEAALLVLYFESKEDPINENINLARKWLRWALDDILKAQKIAHRIL